MDDSMNIKREMYPIGDSVMYDSKHIKREMYRIGDRVRVVKTRPVMDKYYAYLWVDAMDKFLGEEAMVTKTYRRNAYVNITCDNSALMWHPDWLEAL